jgi:hypothetical protein
VLDTLRQLYSRRLQNWELGVTSADGSTPKVGAQSATELGGSANAEPFLKGPVIVVRGAQQRPEPVPHVVQRLSELFKPVFRWPAERQPNLDSPQSRIQKRDLLPQARLLFRTTPGIHRRPWLAAGVERIVFMDCPPVNRQAVDYSRYASTEALRSRRSSVSPLTMELQEIS